MVYKLSIHGTLADNYFFTSWLRQKSDDSKESHKALVALEVMASITTKTVFRWLLWGCYLQSKSSCQRLASAASALLVLAGALMVLRY